MPSPDSRLEAALERTSVGVVLDVTCASLLLLWQRLGKLYMKQERSAQSESFVGLSQRLPCRLRRVPCVPVGTLSSAYLLQADEADSEAEDSDVDDDAQAKAERLSSRVEPKEGVLPASAAAWTAASADAPASDAKRAGSSRSQKGGKAGKQGSAPGRRQKAQQTASADGSAQKGGLLRDGSASAEAAGSAREPGHEAYRPDILAHVARKQREHLLDAKIGADQSHVPWCQRALGLPALESASAHRWAYCLASG